MTVPFIALRSCLSSELLCLSAICCGFCRIMEWNFRPKEWRKTPSTNRYPDVGRRQTTAHSNVLAWRITGTGEPGGLPSMGSQRVKHDWSDLAAADWLSILGRQHTAVSVASQVASVLHTWLGYMARQISSQKLHTKPWSRRKVAWLRWATSKSHHPRSPPLLAIQAGDTNKTDSEVLSPSGDCSSPVFYE